MTQMYTKYPEKFLDGSVAEIGSGQKPFFVIITEGMEYLTKKTEREANRGSWLILR